MSPFLLAAVALLVAGAAVSGLGAASRLPLRRMARAMSWLALGSALAAAVASAANSTDLTGPLFAALAAGVTAIVQSWSVRHLCGDPRATRFHVLSSLLAAALITAAAADQVAFLAIGWIAATGAMIGLLSSGGPTPQAAVAIRRSATALGVGDLALLSALLLTAIAAGPSLNDIGALDGGTATVVGVLVAIAAITRAGSVPFHQWLPATLAAPTPVSALLHAGFVNAGALLLIRFAPLDSWSAPAIAGIAGGVTVVVAGAVMLTRPDIKGRLVHSTAAQMGFMLLACSIGAFALALVHVLGHALYKSYRFLAAGSALHSPNPSGRIEDRGTGAASTPPLRAAGASTLGALLVTACAGLAGSFTHPGGALVPFIGVTVWIGVWGAARSAWRLRWALAALIATTGAGYVLVWAWIENAFPLAPAEPTPPWLALAVFIAAGVAAAGLTRAAPKPIREFAYVAASGWARPPVPEAPNGSRAATPEPQEYWRSAR